MNLLNKSIFFCLFLVVGMLISCTNQSSIQEKGTKQVYHTPKKAVTLLVDSCCNYLKNGCIVLRTGNDVISSMFAKFNTMDKTYSHCGIAFQEEGKWYVYHSIGGEDNPDEKLRRDTYERFVSQEHNLGFGICNLGLNTQEQANLKEVVYQFYQQHLPFDMKFDLGSNDRLYCAEMVFKAYHTALNTRSFFKTTIHKSFEFVSTDNIFVNNHAQMLCRVTY